MSFLFKKSKKSDDDTNIVKKPKEVVVEEETMPYSTFEDAAKQNDGFRYMRCPVKLFNTTTMDNTLISYNKSDFIPMMKTFQTLGKELLDDIESHLGSEEIQETRLFQEFLRLYYDSDLHSGSMSGKSKKLSSSYSIKTPNEFLLVGYKISDYVRVANNILRRLDYFVRFTKNKCIKDFPSLEELINYHVDMVLSLVMEFRKNNDLMLSRYNHIVNKEILEKPFEVWNEE